MLWLILLGISLSIYLSVGTAVSKENIKTPNDFQYWITIQINEPYKLVQLEWEAIPEIKPGESNHDKEIRLAIEAKNRSITKRVGNSQILVLAYKIAEEYGIANQWGYIYELGQRESGWNPKARNRSSGACGIPQALPCNKMKDQSTNGQIRWFYSYTLNRYGSFGNAISFHDKMNWY